MKKGMTIVFLFLLILSATSVFSLDYKAIKEKDISYFNKHYLNDVINYDNAKEKYLTSQKITGKVVSPENSLEGKEIYSSRMFLYKNRVW